MRSIRGNGILRIHHDRGHPHVNHIITAEEQVLQMVEEDPMVSTRAVSRHVVVSHSTACRILNRESMHLYHYKRVQDLFITKGFLQRLATPEKDFLINTMTTYGWSITHMLPANQITRKGSV